MKLSVKMLLPKNSKNFKGNHIYCKSKLLFKKFNRSNNDSKSTWKTLNHISKTNRMFPTIKLEADNTVIAEPTEIANRFKEYFPHFHEELMNNITPTTASPLTTMNCHLI